MQIQLIHMPYYIKGPCRIQSSGLMCDIHVCINNKKKCWFLKNNKNPNSYVFFFTCYENVKVIVPNCDWKSQRNKIFPTSVKNSEHTQMGALTIFILVISFIKVSSNFLMLFPKSNTLFQVRIYCNFPQVFPDRDQKEIKRE